ncbi:hypothetical protein PVAR5_1660 [Paecilomyces variotii No. 5]|uniref:Uncharacterized protein n=1 Tax=Byssochlamys spectabilis (strain No. 5 / NBRC 109023) TaxID=1356009 RepID=V5HU13_BYSSN|nr:hypothetical protein PVAR5_1660 [Paecilomyces variotii No. 5]
MSESSKVRIGDFNMPREEVSDVLREEDPEKSRADPHVAHDRKPKKRDPNQPNRAPTANKHTSGGGSAAKRLSRSRSKDIEEVYERIVFLGSLRSILLQDTIQFLIENSLHRMVKDFFFRRSF